MCRLTCFAEGDRRLKSSLLQLPPKGDGEPRPADGIQSAKNEEVGERDLVT